MKKMRIPKLRKPKMPKGMRGKSPKVPKFTMPGVEPMMGRTRRGRGGMMPPPIIP